MIISLSFYQCSKEDDSSLTYGTMTDLEDNIYNTIEIGTQIWMAENLRATKYNDGTLIELVTDNNSWAGLTTPAYCWYDNSNATFGSNYGALYNWHTVNTGKLCPVGWHVPSDEEWKTLEMHLGMSKNAADQFGLSRGKDEGGKMKESGTTHWGSPNISANNGSGFTALPGGSRFHNDGSFSGMWVFGDWWSSTENSANEAWVRRLSFESSNVLRSYESKGNGFSVRCLKD